VLNPEGQRVYLLLAVDVWFLRGILSLFCAGLA
jgi:hypothetical protein